MHTKLYSLLTISKRICSDVELSVFFSFHSAISVTFLYNISCRFHPIPFTDLIIKKIKHFHEKNREKEEGNGLKEWKLER